MRAARKGFVAVMGIRVVALVAAIAAALGVLATTAAGQASKERTAATEVGVTGTEIHIAVIADVDNSIAPNIFLGARDAVQGFARYINASCATKNRCLAGRKLVVDFYDSMLNANEARNDEIKACANDFAMVGTSAALLTEVDDMRNCKDQAGVTTGIPDVPFVTTAVVQQCSDQSFPVASPQVICSTKDQHPQTYQPNIARAYYYQKKFGNSLHGVYVFANDSKAARDSSFSSLGQMRAMGIKSDEDFDRSGGATQSEFTAIVVSIKSHNSNYAQCTGQYTCTVNLRKEATVQGVSSIKVWDCGIQCYDKKFIATGGSDVEGEYVDSLFLPFYDPREQKANPMLANFVRYTGADKVDGFGAYAWSAAVAFRDAVNAIVNAHGVNGLTRVNLLAALNHIHKFNADGMSGTMDLAGRKTSDCHVLMQVRNGTFVRVQPTKPGAFDCNPKYVITREFNLLTSP